MSWLHWRLIFWGNIAGQTRTRWRRPSRRSSSTNSEAMCRAASSDRRSSPLRTKNPFQFAFSSLVSFHFFRDSLRLGVRSSRASEHIGRQLDLCRRIGRIWPPPKSSQVLSKCPLPSLLWPSCILYMSSHGRNVMATCHKGCWFVLVVGKYAMPDEPFTLPLCPKVS